MVATNPVGADELAAPLDLLLTRSAVGVAERVMPKRCAEPIRAEPGQEATPGGVAGSLAGPGIGLHCRGRSDVAPANGDKRFTDPAWQDKPLLKRTMQAYPATNATVDELFSDAHLD